MDRVIPLTDLCRVCIIPQVSLSVISLYLLGMTPPGFHLLFALMPRPPHLHFTYLCLHATTYTSDSSDVMFIIFYFCKLKYYWHHNQCCLPSFLLAMSQLVYILTFEDILRTIITRQKQKRNIHTEDDYTTM